MIESSDQINSALFRRWWKEPQQPDDDDDEETAGPALPLDTPPVSATTAT